MPVNENCIYTSSDEESFIKTFFMNFINMQKINKKDTLKEKTPEQILFDKQKEIIDNNLKNIGIV